MKHTLVAATAITTLLAAFPALAHDSHGLSGSHWHATDTLGFVAMGLVLALAVWFSRGGK